MKTLYLALLSLGSLLVLLPVMAGAQDTDPALRQQATTATRALAAFISLDDARQLPVRRLVQLRLSQEAEARTQYANDPAMLSNKLTAIGREYTAQLGTILSPSQFERLLAAAPNALPVIVAAIPLPTPVPVPASVITPAPSPVVAKAPVPRRPTGPLGRSAAAKQPAKAPTRPRAPASSPTRH